MVGKKVLVSGVAGLLMLGTVAGTVSAQTPQPQTPSGPRAGVAQQQNWQGRGMGYQTAEAPAAKVLGMTVDQLHAERLSGKSLAEIAKAKGVSADALVNAMVESRKTILDARVKAGTLTQSQEDEALKAMKAQMTQSITRTEIGPNQTAPHLGLGFGFGRGMGFQTGPQDGTGFGPRGFRR